MKTECPGTAVRGLDRGRVYEASRCRCDLRAHAGGMLQHAKLDDFRPAERLARAHHVAIRVRACRRRGAHFARTNLPHAVLDVGERKRVQRELRAARLSAADGPGARRSSQRAGRSRIRTASPTHGAQSGLRGAAAGSAAIGTQKTSAGEAKARGQTGTGRYGARTGTCARLAVAAAAMSSIAVS
jgi:hypothetical protein